MILRKDCLPCFFISLVLFAGLPQLVHSSEATNSCHCFRNRTFNTEDKFASDDYLLTTTFNSLLASEFKISKRQIIMMKMQEGVANNDLVNSLYLSRETGVEVSRLLEMKKKQPWQQIITQLKAGKISPDAKDPFNFITAGASDDQITDYITNRLIITRFSPAPESLEFLKKNNLNSREIILANILADHTGISVLAITDQYKKNGLSWSEIAHNFGLEPADVAKLLEPAERVNE